jgi:lycopene beta-cyclase
LKSATIYDLAIIGAGAAGLQLLYEYLQLAENIEKKVLLIDSGDRSNKSWCFWAEKGQESFPFLIQKSWSKISYCSSEGRIQTEEIDNLQYHYISSEHFFEYFFEKYITHHSQITLENGWVNSLSEKSENVTIQLKNGHSYQAKQVADSRIDQINQSQKPILYQHFWGKFIEFESEVLDSNAVTLMDFSQDQTNSAFTLFHYILPFTQRKALIETTVFSTQPYDEVEYEKHWNQYMNDTYFGLSYQVESTEKGTIPMVQIKSQQTKGAIFSIGTASGKVKPSTGYAFTRMHRDAKEIVKQQKSGLKTRYNFYDSILLHMIKTENSAIPAVMDRLFSKMKHTNILRFLDEKTSLWEEIKLFSQLQIPLFIKHLLTKNR